jgi:IPT/TIG domain
LRTFWKSVWLLLSIAVGATSVFAQNYPLPGAVPDPPVICTGCPGTNSVGEANAGQPTYPYDLPLSRLAGRYVDSSSTANVQNVGMRTVRAGIVRVAPGLTNRIYLALGATVGAYTLDTFFSGKLQQPMVAVNTINTGLSYKSSRNPFEKLAKPDRFFYPESPFAGWTIPLIDAQDVLNDFDADDRGYVYLATQAFGWGMVSDPGGADGSHLPSVAQVTDYATINALLSLKSDPSYHVYTSNASSSASLYDVSTGSPVSSGTRSGISNAFSAWSKYESGARVALLNIDGHARVYTYAGLIAGSAPLADFTPSEAGKFFADLSFDDDGNLWLAESTNSAAVNSLRKEAPSGGGYTSTFYNAYLGAAFAPRKIHSAGGYIVVAGLGPSGASDLYLFQIVGGSPALMGAPGIFINRYYHRAPSGYAQPGNSLLTGVRLVAQGGKTYLFYSAKGLGDVYEIGMEPRITSMAPLSGSPVGGTSVDIYGSGFTPDATVTFDGLTASSSFVSLTHMTAVAPVHASGPVDVVVSVPAAVPMTAPRKFTYEFPAPANLAATATSPTTVSINWSAVPGATQYEVARLASNVAPQSWTVIGTVFGTSLGDTDRIADTTYLYRVRAGDGITFSAQNSVDAVTMMSDSPISVGALIVSTDLVNLRARVNSVRSTAGLSLSSYTDPTSTPVLATHITELRTRLTQARTALGLATPAFTDPSLTGIPVKALHFNELLDLMR